MRTALIVITALLLPVAVGPGAVTHFRNVVVTPGP
jgi:hypothetical protein